MKHKATLFQFFSLEFRLRRALTPYEMADTATAVCSVPQEKQRPVREGSSREAYMRLFRCFPARAETCSRVSRNGRARCTHAPVLSPPPYIPREIFRVTTAQVPEPLLSSSVHGLQLYYPCCCHLGTNLAFAGQRSKISCHTSVGTCRSR